MKSRRFRGEGILDDATLLLSGKAQGPNTMGIFEGQQTMIGDDRHDGIGSRGGIFVMTVHGPLQGRKELFFHEGGRICGLIGFSG